MRFKKIIGALLFAIAIAAATPAAQAAGIFRFGVKAGLTVDKLKFNTDLLDSDNKTGYTFGVMTKFTVPVVNLGFDASLMYTHREFDSDVTVMSPDGTLVAGTATFKNNYIEIPVNFRYDLGLPGIGKVITPFLTTGPDFSFLVSKRHYDFWNRRSATWHGTSVSAWYSSTICSCTPATVWGSPTQDRASTTRSTAKAASGT